MEPENLSPVAAFIKGMELLSYVYREKLEEIFPPETEKNIPGKWTTQQLASHEFRDALDKLVFWVIPHLVPEIVFLYRNLTDKVVEDSKC